MQAGLKDPLRLLLLLHVYVYALTTIFVHLFLVLVNSNVTNNKSIMFDLLYNHSK